MSQTFADIVSCIYSGGKTGSFILLDSQGKIVPINGSKIIEEYNDDFFSSLDDSEFLPNLAKVTGGKVKIVTTTNISGTKITDVESTKRIEDLYNDWLDFISKNNLLQYYNNEKKTIVDKFFTKANYSLPENVCQYINSKNSQAYINPFENNNNNTIAAAFINEVFPQFVDFKVSMANNYLVLTENDRETFFLEEDEEKINGKLEPVQNTGSL